MSTMTYFWKNHILWEKYFPKLCRTSFYNFYSWILYFWSHVANGSHYLRRTIQSRSHALNDNYFFFHFCHFEVCCTGAAVFLKHEIWFRRKILRQSEFQYRGVGSVLPTKCKNYKRQWRIPVSTMNAPRPATKFIYASFSWQSCKNERENIWGVLHRRCSISDAWNLV